MGYGKTVSGILRESFANKWIRLALIFSVALICYYGSIHIVIHRKAYADVRAIPFVLKLDSYSFKDSPVGELFHKSLVARRSDAATVIISSVGQLKWAKTVKKLTFNDGERVTIFDLIRGKTSWKLKPSALATLKDRLENHPSDCVFGDARFIRNDVLLNHPVVVVESNSAEEHVTRWMAPDLGCESMQFQYEQVQSDGSFKLLSETRPVELTLGEPDAGLFDPAQDYEELKPSVAQSRYFQKLGLPEDDESKQSTERLDKKYADQRK